MAGIDKTYTDSYKDYIEFKNWADSDVLHYPYNTDTSLPTSIKALIKHLRKQYLPKGLTFRLSGGYVGEDYIVVIS